MGFSFTENSAKTSKQGLEEWKLTHRNEQVEAQVLNHQVAQDKSADVLKTIRDEEKAKQAQGSALGFGFDNFQKLLGSGVKTIGDLAENDFVVQLADDFIKKQDREIKENNYQSTYTKPFSETVLDSPISGLGWVAEKTLENAASGAFAIGSTILAAATLPISAPLAAVIGTTA